MTERKVELTSAAWITDPERLFWIAGSLNKERPQSEQLAVELYPVHYLGGIPLGPGRILADKVKEWKQEHGEVQIERIHLPFHWSVSSATKRFLTSFFQQQGTLKDRWTAMKVGVAIGTVQNRYAMKLAGELDSGFNAHVSIIEEAQKRGKIDELKANSRYIWVENDLDYPRKNPGDIQKARDPVRAVSAVEGNGLDGVILGIDHAYNFGIDPKEDFEKTGVSDMLKKNLRCLHLAGSTSFGEAGHGLIREDDKDFWALVNVVKGRDFDHDIVFCLDLNPFEMKHLTQSEQLDYIKRTVKKLEE